MGTDNTSTPSSFDEVREAIRQFSVVLYCVIIMVGTVGNSLVIYVTGFKMKRTVNSVWFLNLAIADLLFTGFLIFTAISYHHNWPFGNFMCQLNTFIVAGNMFASIYLLTAISLDRCLSVWVVVWAQNKRTIRKAQITCAVIWMMAGACSFPFAFVRGVVELREKKYCTSLTKEKFLTVFRFVLGFLIPFLVIVFSYVAISVRARHLKRTRKRRSNRIIFSIIFAFFICWLPFHVVQFIGLEVERNPALKSVFIIGGPLTLSLAFMNSCLNPILYVFMCDEFLKKLRQSICLVLESALAEDGMSFASSRSLTSWMSRKSSSGASSERRDVGTSLTFMEDKVFNNDNINIDKDANK